MSAESESSWPVSGLLSSSLGATAWSCVHCSRPGVKRNEKIYEQRNRQENAQSSAAAQTYSSARQVWPGPQMDTAPNKSFERKNKMSFSHLEGSNQEPDAAYVDPIPTNYYNWGCFQKPSEDDDSNSYENVLVCKPSTPESGVEDFEDYQNSVSIHQWRESKRTMGAPMSLSGSPDEEPDYVNGDVAAAENI